MDNNLEKDLLQLVETGSNLEPKALKLALFDLAKRAAIVETKAKKWDDLGEEIAAFYNDDEDEDDEDDMGLINIGEAAASAYGFL